MAEQLTVIIVALLGGEALDQCVQAVRRQCSNVLTVRRDGTIADTEGRSIGVADRQDIPNKRRSGVELAATPLVALLEDTVIPGRNWADAATSALSQNGVAGCGGPVNALEDLPAQTRALILSEYGRYNDRRAAGEVSGLPGCNFAFRRDALIEAMQGSGGLVDLPVFAQLNDAAHKLIWEPEMAVTFSHSYPEGASLKTRFDHGRIYASGHPGLVARAATVAKTPILPAVLTVRTVKQAGRVEASTLAWLALQHSAWAAGELVGALLGPSRKGLGQWR